MPIRDNFGAFWLMIMGAWTLTFAKMFILAIVINVHYQIRHKCSFCACTLMCGIIIKSNWAVCLDCKRGSIGPGNVKYAAVHVTRLWTFIQLSSTHIKQATYTRIYRVISAMNAAAEITAKISP